MGGWSEETRAAEDDRRRDRLLAVARLPGHEPASFPAASVVAQVGDDEEFTMIPPSRGRRRWDDDNM